MRDNEGKTKAPSHRDVIVAMASTKQMDSGARDRLICAAYRSDPEATYRGLAKRSGLSYERIRQIVQVGGLVEAKASRARIREERGRERLFAEFARRVATAKPCKICDRWVLRGSGHQVTCSPECAAALRTSSVRFIVDESAWSEHREWMAWYWTKQDDPAKQRYADRILHGQVDTRKRYYIPGSKASEALKWAAPWKLPPASGTPRVDKDDGTASKPMSDNVGPLHNRPRLAPGNVRAGVDFTIDWLVATGNRALQDNVDRMRRFASFLEALGVDSLDAVTPEDALRFINSRRWSGEPPTDNERMLRRRALGLLFRSAGKLGVALSDPTGSIFRSPGTWSCLPLVDSEIDLGRSYAVRIGETRPSVCWALAESGAWVSEMPFIALSDYCAETGSVFLHGGARTDPRVAQLTPWGRAQIERRVRSLTTAEGPNPVLMGRGGWSHPYQGRAAASRTITTTLRLAGLARPGVDSRSIPAWAGATALANGGAIDAVARMLGVRSLDKAAALVGFDWRNQP